MYCYIMYICKYVLSDLLDPVALRLLHIAAAHIRARLPHPQHLCRRRRARGRRCCYPHVATIPDFTPPLAPPRSRAAEDDAAHALAPPPPLPPPPTATTTSTPTAAAAVRLSSSLSSASPSFSPAAIASSSAPIAPSAARAMTPLTAATLARSNATSSNYVTHVHHVTPATNANTNNSNATTPAPLNPLVLFQTIVAGEHVPVKQRYKAAQQLESYFLALPSTPSVFALYEPFLPMLIEIASAPTKPATKDAIESVARLLNAFARHNPHKSVEWVVQNIHTTLAGHEVWLLEWTAAIVVASEQRIPRVVASTNSSFNNSEWREKSLEFLEFETALARVCSLYRTVLDATAAPAVVAQIVVQLQQLLLAPRNCQTQWRATLHKKLQPHFIDMADVFVGWAMSANLESRLRDAIVSLLHAMQQLWVDNSVFSAQLLASFASDIVALTTSTTATLASDATLRLNTLTTCFFLVAQCVPNVALKATGNNAHSPFANVVDSAAASRHGAFSVWGLERSVSFLLALATSSTSKRLFAPHALASIRFVLVQLALLSHRSHDCAIDRVRAILDTTLQLLTASGNTIQALDAVDVNSQQQQATDAATILNDTIAGRTNKQPIKAIEVLLLAFRSDQSTKLLAQLVLQLTRVGGVHALQILVRDALRPTGQRLQESASPRSFAVFSAACFVAAVRFVDARAAAVDHRNDESQLLEIVNTVLQRWTAFAGVNDDHWRMRVLVKVSRACLCWLDSVVPATHDGTMRAAVAKTQAHDLWLYLLRAAVRATSDATTAIMNDREALTLLASLLSRRRRRLVEPIPQSLLLQVATTVQRVMRSRQKSAARTACCVTILEALAALTDASSTLASVVFDMSVDLVLDADDSIATAAVKNVLSTLALSPLLLQTPLQHPPLAAATPLDASLFPAAAFASVMTALSNQESRLSEWHSVGRVVQLHTSDASEDALASNASLLLTTVRHAAKWCVQIRLRTHFGGPAQTFASLERLLMAFTGSSSSDDASSGRLAKALVLEFVSALELSIADAATDLTTTDASSDSESDAHKTLAFFKANRKVCDDWLSRIRPLLLEIATTLPSPPLMRHHATAIVHVVSRRLTRLLLSLHPQTPPTSEQFHDITHCTTDLDSAVFALCRSFSALRDVDSIVGVEAWRDALAATLAKRLDAIARVDVDGVASWDLPLFPWLAAVRLEAAMQYEDAAAAATRKWPQLRRFATTIVQLVAAIEASGIALVGCNDVLAVCRTWQAELDVLEAMDAAETTVSDMESKQQQQQFWIGTSSSSLDALGAAQSWKALDASKRLPLHADDDALGHVRADLSLLALQPTALHPVAGEFVSKDTERVLLRLGRLAPTASAFGAAVADALASATRLDPMQHDAGAWSDLYGAVHAMDSGSVDALAASDAMMQQLSSPAFLPSLVDVARLARQQHNFALSTQLLDKATAVVSHTQTADASVAAVTLERSQLLVALGQSNEATQLLLSLVESDAHEAPAAAARVEPLLQLVELCDAPQSLALVTHLTERLAINGDDVADAVAPIDTVKRQLLVAATQSDPQSHSAWLGYSNWCYANANATIDRIAAQDGNIELNAADDALIHKHLDQLELDTSDRDAVMRCFLQLIEHGSLLLYRSSALRQLCVQRASASVNPTAIDALVALQQTLHARALRFHRLAAEGYSRCLTVAATAATSDRTTVAVRLLRLLTRFGADDNVADAIDAAFTLGPVAPWRAVVPQLLARAAHPMPRVASLLRQLLVRLARDAPQLVVYPAVVASTQLSTPSLTRAGDVGKAKMLTDVLLELRRGGSSDNATSDLVRGVELLVTELQRISILWDEAWLATLHKLSADVARRASTLAKEAARVERNASLSQVEKTELARRKFVAIMWPILMTLERKWRDTCGDTSSAQMKATRTPHEKLFLQRFGKRIADATQRLRDACDADATFDPRIALPGPAFVWNAFTEILKALQSSIGRTESLALREIAPALAALSTQSFKIYVPGVVPSSSRSTGADNNVVRGVRSTVLVLRTKTKPKCLEFLGTDGRAFKYLLKAREDLRLDERIMQLLATANAFLGADAAAAARDLCAQHYSVLPLSRDSGLIQMVPDVTPLFQIYNATQATQQQSPTAAFYAKLQHYGVVDVAPTQRPQWPESILRQVFHDLVAARPRNVVQRELARSSHDVAECWSKTTRLSKSLAVMSALGYVIGLGDRHLDNILLSPTTGDVLHIDYNVCFDKGLKLKVPEIVPFRLTPMLQDALGFTGVDGPFRIALETTLRVVRASDARESLLALLEAFVYDPLTDWTTDDDDMRRRDGDDSKSLKSRLEVNVNLSLFLSRAEERRHDATAFAHALAAALHGFASSLDAVASDVTALFADTAALTRLEQHEATLVADFEAYDARLAECEALEQTAHQQLDAATMRLAQATANRQGFADQCRARHGQILAYKSQCKHFQQPEMLGNVLTAAADASFAPLCAQLVATAAATRTTMPLPPDVVTSLTAKSQVIDAGVAQLRFALERVMVQLQPLLVRYCDTRDAVDAFVAFETHNAANDIYWHWQQRCDVIATLLERNDVDNATAIVAAATLRPQSLVASASALDESIAIVQQSSDQEQRGAAQDEALRYHRCRLAYARWFAPQSHAVSDSQLTQAQLLAVLPAFVTELNRLTADQSALGSLVLELAQQLEYLASHVVRADATFHSVVQMRYAHVSALFGVVRDVTELLQGIQIVETSTSESAGSLENNSINSSSELEVDVIGRTVLHESVDATQCALAAQTQLVEQTAAAARVRSDVQSRQPALTHARDARVTLAARVYGQCDERAAAIAATAADVAQHAQRVAALLQAFDSLRTAPVGSANVRSVNDEAAVPRPEPASSSAKQPQRRRRTTATADAAKRTIVGPVAASAPVPSFSFIENERLVKILLRNIQAAEHLKPLEVVLEKHEATSATLHHVVATIDDAVQQLVHALNSLEPQTLDASSNRSAWLAATTQQSTNVTTTSDAASSHPPRSFVLVRALQALHSALVQAPTTDAAVVAVGTDAASTNNVVTRAATLATVCFKHFFDATDMADRLSAREQSALGTIDAGNDIDEDGGSDGIASDNDSAATGDVDTFNVVVHGDDDGDNGVDSDTAPSSSNDGSSLVVVTANDRSISSTNALVQATNRHGLHVLKRVDDKLRGVVSVHGDVRTLNVTEQARWLIDEATKVDNLSRMYEGWTPWI